jgi:hypothetical protein
LGIVPFLLYWHGLAMHWVSTSKAWYANGANHGPWASCRHGTLFTLCWFILLCLTIVTAGTGLVEALDGKSWRPFLIGLGLVCFQLVVLLVNIICLVWLIT